MSTLGDRIKQYRKEKGLTQKQLAELIGAKHNSISDWENNKNKPDADTIEYLLGVFEVDANTLLGWNEHGKIVEDARILADKIMENPHVKKALPIINALNDEDMELLLSFIGRLSKENKKKGD